MCARGIELVPFHSQIGRRDRQYNRHCDESEIYQWWEICEEDEPSDTTSVTPLYHIDTNPER